MGGHEMRAGLRPRTRCLERKRDGQRAHWSPFVLSAGDKEQVLDPERGDPTSLCPALRILHQTVDSALAYRDGTLDLRFSGGTRITASPDAEYEAWEAAGGEGCLLIVSLPGGGVSVWNPRARNASP